jgi:exodeoxyribonuclease X
LASAPCPFGQVTLHFGKHRGKPLQDIPADYLIWVLQNCSRLNPCMREAIEGFLRD